jgi:hypothetical protein
MQTLPLFNYKVTSLTNKIQLKKMMKSIKKNGPQLTTRFYIEVVTATTTSKLTISTVGCEDRDIVIEGCYRSLNLADSNVIVVMVLCWYC